VTGWAHRAALAVGAAILALCLGLSFNPGAMPAGLSPEGMRTLGVAAAMATWWIGSDLPLAVPALLPLALFPALGVADSASVSAAYADKVVMLLLCGFLLALAVERWGLHRRLALHVLVRVGDRPSALTLGTMGITSVISWWISNTAATLMMLPIVLALVDQGARENQDAESNRRFAATMLLGLAWAASIGGVATPVGTPPNLVFQGIHARQFPDAPPVDFLAWMRFGVPIALLLLLLTWTLLDRVILPLPGDYRFGARETLRAELRAMGRWTTAERRVLAGFATVCLLWVFRPILHAWGLPKAVDDTTIGALGLVAFFLCPAGGGTGRALLTWEEGAKAPWDLVLLFGGGIALSAAFQSSGLTEWLAGRMTPLLALPPLLTMAAISLVVLAVTELASNTATAALVLPVLASMAKATGTDPLDLMVPATVMASMGFAMPVGTAPNALVVGTGRVSPGEMMRAGWKVDLLAVVVVVAVMALLG
jgi:sodium-dependent dicarboxylate transporter 2/3/5